MKITSGLINFVIGFCCLTMSYMVYNSYIIKNNDMSKWDTIITAQVYYKFVYSYSQLEVFIHKC